MCVCLCVCVRQRDLSGLLRGRLQTAIAEKRQLLDRPPAATSLSLSASSSPSSSSSSWAFVALFRYLALVQVSNKRWEERPSLPFFLPLLPFFLPACLPA